MRKRVVLTCIGISILSLALNIYGLDSQTNRNRCIFLLIMHSSCFFIQGMAFGTMLADKSRKRLLEICQEQQNLLVEIMHSTTKKSKERQ